jgi:hypothetical protein
METAAVKISANISASSLAALDARDRGRGEGGRGGALDTLVDRYCECVRRELPDLTVPEWHLLVDTLHGVLHEPASMIAVSAHGIADAIELDGLGAWRGVDGADLVRRLRALSYAGLLAVVDTAERYWSAVGRGESPKVPSEV